jgi:hypothetical protein
LASRPEIVDELVRNGVHPTRAVGVTKYLMDAGVIPRSTRGRHGPGRVRSGPMEMSGVVVGCTAPLYSQAAATVDRFKDHVAEAGSVLAGVGLREWLADTIRSFAAMTPQQMASALKDDGLLVLQVDPYDPNPFTAVAWIEWGPVEHRQKVIFRYPEPYTPLGEILGEQAPACSTTFAFKASFRLLLALAKLLPEESAENLRQEAPAPFS